MANPIGSTTVRPMSGRSFRYEKLTLLRLKGGSVREAKGNNAKEFVALSAPFGCAPDARFLPRLSLCMIVKNEAGNLAPVLRSISAVLDEITLSIQEVLPLTIPRGLHSQIYKGHRLFHGGDDFSARFEY